MAFPALAPLLIGGLKALLVSAAESLFVYLIYKLFMSIGSTSVSWGLNQISSNVNLSDATVQLTGVAAWLADSLRLGQIVTLFISFCVVRFTVSMAGRKL